MKIERVVSPGGIEAWLVESHANPLIAMRFAFRGGASQDDPGKEGLAYFISAMMDEGAGDLDAVAFQEREQGLAMRMDFDASRDVMLGNVQTLTANQDAVFDLVRLALTKPRFDKDAVERVRAQILAGLKFDENDPETVASLAWDRLAFPSHPYGRPVKGTTASIASISPDDLRSYSDRVFARDKLVISVVGDIDATALGRALDHMFGALPAKAVLAPVADANPPLGPSQQIIEMDVPQSVAQFGHRGIARKDDDFIAGLRAQLHHRRRRFLLAADGRGAREARARLFGPFQFVSVPARCRVCRQRRHQERGSRPVARGDRGRAAAARRAGPDSRGA